MKETRIEIRKKCEDATYTVQYADGTVIETGAIPSGGSKTITVPPGVDATWTLVDEDGNTLNTGTIEAGGSAVIEAPNADYVITDEGSNILYNGAIVSGGNLAQQISNSTFETKQSDGTTIHTDSILAEGNGSRNIADSVVTLEDTNNNTISTTNVKATDSATIQAPDGTVTVVDSDSNVLGGVVVPSGGSDTFVVADLPCGLSGDGFAEIKKSDGTAITTVTVPSETTVPYNVADSTISIANGTINVKATDPVTITHEDTNGNPVNTSLNGTVVVVDDLPNTELGIAIPFQEDDTTVSVDVIAYSAGTITSILNGGLTNLSIFINGNPVTTPFSIATGDLITLTFDQAVADGVVTLLGNHA